ncbi:MAG TPA: hypothetical protein VE569_09750 [Acidimicrobiia bacterium]|jgi:hypothetical protein|nr:hypothetical protein [Acidimicrobiia bacterium]
MEQGRVTGSNLDVEDPELRCFVHQAMMRFFLDRDDGLSTQNTRSRRNQEDHGWSSHG